MSTRSDQEEAMGTLGLPNNLSTPNSPPTYKAWTIAKITTELLRRGIPFSASARKAELFKLLFATPQANRFSSSSSPVRQIGGVDIQTTLTELAASIALVHSRLDAIEASQAQARLQIRQDVVPEATHESTPTPHTENSPPIISPAHYVPAHIKKDILEGKDINLVSLLISSQDGIESKAFHSETMSVVLKARDPRLGKKLNIAEFVIAFSLYRDVICSVHPLRREELDRYMFRIVELGHKYGGNSFYDYHRSFSAKAAADQAQLNYITDWGKLDTELFCRHFAGLRSPTCAVCQSAEHHSNLCPTAAVPSCSSAQTLVSSENPNPPNQGVKKLDRLGRPITYLGKSQICNNYNYTGCSFNGCRLLHICINCFDAHPKTICPKRLFPRP
ncbi:uncharacterized protein WCC33_009834 [Rhinophrynus dorsalis]